MTSLASSHYRPPTGFITRKLLEIIQFQFPRKAKRLIFVSSLIAVFKNIDQADDVFLDKVNEVFNYRLANNARSMLLPMYANKVIWKNIDNPENGFSVMKTKIGIRDVASIMNSEEGVDEEIVQSVARHVVSVTPRCLVYGSDELMVSDVVKVLKEISKIQ